MFSGLLGRKPEAKTIEVKELAVLAPLRHLKAERLAAVAERTRHVSVETGQIDPKLLADNHVFLDMGKLRVDCQNGDLLSLQGKTNAAHFPLPHGPQVVRIDAAGHSELIVIPHSVRIPEPVNPGPEPGMPTLSTDERSAFEQMRQQFAARHIDLPALPDLALKIGKAIDDPKNLNEDIARLIQLDPSLTARVISVVNSAAFGGISKISTINQATSRLGRHKVRGLVYSCLLKNIFKANSTMLKQRMETLWHDSAQVAALSFMLGRVTPGIDPEQAMLAGLIHDIGALAVMGGIAHFPALAEREETIEHAIATLGTKAAEQTLKSWNLLEEFGDVACNMDNWHRTGAAIADYTDIVQLAKLHALVGRHHKVPPPPIDSIPAFDKLADGKLSPHRSLAILDEAAAEVREVQALIEGA